VRSLVMEVTDDKTLEKSVRKQMQIEHAPHLSTHAKIIKLADKTANVTDIGHSPPTNWSEQRRIEYLAWSQKVVAGCRGASPELGMLFDERVMEAKQAWRLH
jgi:(p)ppGpp synthase/HD superfamily hydrolase